MSSQLPGCPADEAIVERFTLAVDARGVDPASSGLQHMDDPTDDAAIVDPRLAAKLSLQSRATGLVQSGIYLYIVRYIPVYTPVYARI